MDTYYYWFPIMDLFLFFDRNMVERYGMLIPPTDTVVKAVNMSKGLMQAGKNSISCKGPTKSMYDLSALATSTPRTESHETLKILNYDHSLNTPKPLSRLLENKELKLTRGERVHSDSPHFFQKNESKSELKFTSPRSHSRFPENLFLPPISKDYLDIPKAQSSRNLPAMSPQPAYPRTPSELRLASTPVFSKKTIVLDLDETLIHASPLLINPEQLITRIQKDGSTICIRLNIRPYAEDFLRILSSIADVVVFTASMKQYADPILDLLDPFHKYLKARYYRESCTLSSNGYIKDLNILRKPLKDVLIVDNLAPSFSYQKENGILISSWYGDKNDKELLKLLKFLRKAVLLDDLRITRTTI